MPIPGTIKLHRLEENIEAAAIELNADDLADISNAGSKLQLMVDRLLASALASSRSS